MSLVEESQAKSNSIGSSTVEMVNSVMRERFELRQDQLTPTALLKDDLKLDSLDFVDMIVSFEEKIDRKLEGIDITSIRSLSDIYNLVDSEINKKS